MKNWLKRVQKRLADLATDRRVEQRLRALSEADRARIIAESPLEAAAFQGEGYHVFRKDDPDFTTGYVTSLGEIDPRSAENWIIRQSLRQETGGV